MSEDSSEPETVEDLTAAPIPLALEKFFCTSDRKISEKDFIFWDTLISAYLRAYRDSSNFVTDDTRRTHALNCARLASLGLCMATHFSQGITSVTGIDPNTSEFETPLEIDCADAMAKMDSMFEGHQAKLMEMVIKNEN